MINVFGIRRSRLHVITEALITNLNYKFINNFGGSPLNNNGLEGDELCKDIILKYIQTFANEVGQREIDSANEVAQRVKNTIVLFEDKLYDLSEITCGLSAEKNIIVIRDFYDVVISRIQCMSKGKTFATINSSFIDTYKKILREALNIDNNIENKIIIDTDKFISDSKYRNDILLEFNINNYIYNANHIPYYGGGASFGKGEYRNDIVISDHIKKLINDDIELIKLIEQYYHYNITEKLLR